MNDPHAPTLPGQTPNHTGRIRQTLVNVFALLCVLLAVRIAVNAVLPMFGLPGEPLLVSPDDRFGDALKTALAETAVTGPLMHAPEVADWPPLVQKYLFENDYLRPGATMQHLPPLSTLLLMGIAGLFFWVSPAGIIAILLSIYGAGSLIVARFVERLSREAILLPTFLLICLSYPAVFMMDRGNLHSGFTSLLVVTYVLTAVYGRYRWLGWFAFALAINIRPNVGIFALLEFASDRTWRDLAKAWLVIGVAALVTGLVSLWLTSRIDPTYSLQAFLRAYGWYHANYVESWMGMEWTPSLANLVKLHNFWEHRAALYDPVAAKAIAAVGGLMTLAVTGLYRVRRIAVGHFVFAITTICALFTPVFAEYHVVIFVAPLLIVLLKCAPAFDDKALLRGGGLLIVLLLACILQTLAAALLPLILLSLAFPFIAARLHAGPVGQAEFVLLLASMAALAPLGGAVTNGIAVGLLLFSTLAWLIWQALAKPAALAGNPPQPGSALPLAG